MRYLKAYVRPRYLEDAFVDDIHESDDDPQMPLMVDGEWQLMIDLRDGSVVGWPEGVSAETNYKVCDDGDYDLIGVDGEVYWHKSGYVPAVLAYMDPWFGCGDYVVLKINPDGKIAGFPSGESLASILRRNVTVPIVCR